MSTIGSDAAPTTVCIFVKVPVPGRAKTRLAATIGDERAMALARAFIADTIDLVYALPWARPVLVVEGDRTLLAPIPEGAEVWGQAAGDLGHRMETALRKALTRGQSAFCVGTDSPGLPVEFLEAARAALRESDAVLGPASDGGYYLLGLRRCPEGLLEGIAWSTETALAQTTANLKRHGLTVDLLPSWFDVDVQADLDRLEALLDRGEVTAPHTRAVLEGFAAAGRDQR